MNVDSEAISVAMFWVGALFVFTPMAFAGVILGVWWFQRKKQQANEA